MKKKLVPILPDPKDIDFKIDHASVPQSTWENLGRSYGDAFMGWILQPGNRAKLDEYKRTHPNTKEGVTV